MAFKLRSDIQTYLKLLSTWQKVVLLAVTLFARPVKSFAAWPEVRLVIQEMSC